VPDAVASPFLWRENDRPAIIAAEIVALNATHTGHQRIDQKASFAAWTIGFEEGRAIAGDFRQLCGILRMAARGECIGL
jgi:hypothetical protein